MGQDSRAQSGGAAAEDDTLLQRTAAGDRVAFHCLMEHHSRPMLALAQRVMGNADDADEVVQEVFLKVWTLASKWQPNGKASFSTWLYRVVLNASLDRLRRASFAPLEEAAEVCDDRPSGVDFTLDKQRHRLVARALSSLPPRQQAALTLHYFAELSGPEAARVLDLSLSACEALLARGKRGLKKALQDMGVDGIGDMV